MISLRMKALTRGDSLYQNYLSQVDNSTFPNLNINGLTIECESSIKFLRIWIDENLTLRDHIHTLENKIA